jgi:hypothetical protein
MFSGTKTEDPELKHPVFTVRFLCFLFQGERVVFIQFSRNTGDNHRFVKAIFMHAHPQDTGRPLM